MPLLKEMPRLKPTYLVQNDYFVGAGPSAQKKLGAWLAVRALELLKHEMAEYEDNEPRMKGSEFVKNCKGIKVIEMWQRTCHKEFCKVAAGHPALKRLVEHLTSQYGVSKAVHCMENGLLPHGTGPGNIGIKECYDFWQEMKKQKVGSVPVAIPVGQVIAPAEASASNDQTGDEHADNQLAFAQAAATVCTCRRGYPRKV